MTLSIDFVHDGLAKVKNTDLRYGDRDAPTPEEQVKQILNIAAILPGQKPSSKFRRPTRRESELSRHDSRPETHPHVVPASAPVEQRGGDLIDFSNDEKAPKDRQGAPLEPQKSTATSSSMTSNDAYITNTAAPALTQDPPGFERPQLLKDMTNASGAPRPSGQAAAGAGSGAVGGSSGMADMNELRDGVGKLSVASEGVRSSNSASAASGRERLRRKDSETGEEDEFLDAES